MPPFLVIFCVLKFILYSHMENEIIQHVEAFTEHSSLQPIESIKYWKEGGILFKYELIFPFKHYWHFHSKDSKGDDVWECQRPPSHVLLQLQTRTQQVSTFGFLHLASGMLDGVAGKRAVVALQNDQLCQYTHSLPSFSSINPRVEEDPYYNKQQKSTPNPGKTF